MGTMESGKRNEKGDDSVAFVALLLIAMIGGLAQTMSNTALPSIIDELGISLMLGQWLVTGYILAFCIAMPLFSPLIKRKGVVWLYFAATVIFLLGACCCFLPCFPLLLVGRICQGFAAGLSTPLVQFYVFQAFAPQKRSFLMGITGLAFSFTPNVGPSLSGIFTTCYGWRSVYVFLAGTIVVCLGFGLFAFRDRLFKGGHAVSAGRAARIDMASVACSSIGFGGLLLGISSVSLSSLESLNIWIPLLVGSIATCLFFRRQKRMRQPMITLDVCKVKGFGTAVCVLCLVNASFIGFNLILPLALQNVRGASAMTCGFVLLPAVITTLVASPIAGWAQGRYGTRLVAIVAGLFLTVGTIALLPMGYDQSLFAIAFWQAIRNVGLAPLITTINTWGLAFLGNDTVSDGISFIGVLRQLSSAIGTAGLVLVATLATQLMGEAGDIGAFGITVATGVAAGICVLILVVMFAKVSSCRENGV